MTQGLRAIVSQGPGAGPSGGKDHCGDRAVRSAPSGDSLHPCVVFLVEQYHEARVARARRLREAGYTVYCFGNPGEFLAALDTEHGDCVILDLGLAHKEGISVLDELSRRQSLLPVILLDRNGHSIGAVRALDSTLNSHVFGVSLPRPSTLDRTACALSAVEEDRRLRASADVARRQVSLLTDRQRQVAELLVAGKANKVVAFELGISERTVECHRAHIMKKMKVESFADLVRIFDANSLASDAECQSKTIPRRATLQPLP